MVIKIVSLERQVEVEYKKAKLISEILHENGFSISMPCAGNHTCGKCTVVVNGLVSKITEIEEKLIKNKNERLSCLTHVLGDCEIILYRKQNPYILLEGLTHKFDLQPMGRKYGFAVDVGTTTVAVYCYNLSNGKLMATDAFLNPQSTYGSDVISRIESALKGKNKELSKYTQLQE